MPDLPLSCSDRRATIAPDRWYRDHWTTLAYAFTCLGRGGRLEAARLRLDGDRYPTRIDGGHATIPGHTDLDCLTDIEQAGVLVNVGTGLHPVVRFTEEGLKLGQWLCGAMDARTTRTSELTWEAALTASGAKLQCGPSGVHKAQRHEDARALLAGLGEGA